MLHLNIYKVVDAKKIYCSFVKQLAQTLNMEKYWILLLWSIAFKQTLAQILTEPYFTDLGPSIRRDLPLPDLVVSDGYPCEIHYPVTKDGYILGLYRINTAPKNASCPSNYTDLDPVVFIPGLFLSGDTFIVPGPKKSHAYNFADACFDVWIVNNRGCRYSRNHTTLDPNKNPLFWNFTFYDMATKDLPAVIDYVLEKTNKTQVTIVSHSQGAITAVLLCAVYPAYNDKIKIGFGMSPTAWLDHAKFFVIILQSVIAGILDGRNFTDVEILTHNGPESALGNFLCGFSELQYPQCQAILFAAMGYDNFNIKPDVMEVIPGHFLSGTSMRNFVYWGQIRRNGFRYYDYGSKSNLQIYGQETPPAYDLSPVTMKWIFFSGQNDYVAALEDVQKLTASLNNAENCVLEDKYWGHLDPVYADSLSVYVVPQMLKTLATGSFTCNVF